MGSYCFNIVELSQLDYRLQQLNTINDWILFH